MYTTAHAFIDALLEQQIEYIFANLGSDHPGLIEVLAGAKASGARVPRVITCPNEMVALSIAHGYAQTSGRAQAVIVHVECGTQALAGAVHNAAKARVPVLIFAGASPFTQEGELAGSRNEFIQWIQDVHDQRGLVRGYVRYDAEIRTGANIKQLVHRAMQFAYSDPKGPVYLMAAREVLEAETAEAATDMSRWQPLSPQPIAEPSARHIAELMAAARRPLIVTSYLGRRPEAVAKLVELAHALGVGVLESVPSYVNYPHDDPLYLGNRWNHPEPCEDLAAADLVLVIDSDIPWIPVRGRPGNEARIFHIDLDPLKEQMPLWYIGAQQAFRADALTALSQIVRHVGELRPDEALVRARSAHYAERSSARRLKLREAERPRATLTVEHLLARVRTHLSEDTIVLNEGITNYPQVCDHVAPVHAGTLLASGGGSLGWCGGAAIGVKLARTDATVVAICGDGSYMFSVPSSVHWIARRYQTPFLQIVLNNGGWRAPRQSTLSLYPDGHASREPDLGLSFDPSPDYAGIAEAAGGALALVLDDPGRVDSVLATAFEAVRTQRRAVVVDARIQ